MTEFATMRRNPDGLHGSCKPCWNAYTRARWAAKGDGEKRARAEQNKAWRKSNPEAAAAITRRSKLKTLFGLTQEEYEAMMIAQDGKCAGCDSSDPADRRYSILPVDHDHETGKVRGLLCSNCNRALGLVKDNPDVLLSLAAYLLQSRDVLGVPAREG